MRVIAGKAKGRKLQTLAGDTTRPTPDRVREALFSILGPNAAADHVLALFAGSGALAIEALSRGALKATLVEKHAGARAVITKNLTVLGPQSHAARLLGLPAARALAQCARDGDQFDLIFLDPPYGLELVAPTLLQLMQHHLLRYDGLIVAEHAGATPSPQAPPTLTCFFHRRYGDVALSLYRHAPTTPPASESP